MFDNLTKDRISGLQMPQRLFHNNRLTRRLFAGGAALAPVWAQDVIKIDVERVNVLFSVRDKRNTYVSTLTQDDFQVVEDAKPQTIKTFARETDLPLTLGLLVDVSGSQRNLIEQERAAAAQFFRKVIRQKDLVFLIAFGPEAELLQDSTSSIPMLERGLAEMRGMGGGAATVINPGTIPNSRPKGTILYDSVYLAADEKLRNEAGRKAVILITDGVDQGSRYTVEEAIRMALRTDTLIYSIHYADPGAYGFGGGAYSDGALRKMSEETGGRMFRVDRKNTLDEIFQQLQDEMRSQYSLSYTSTNEKRDGGFRKLEIKTKNKDLKVQARKGYFAPTG